MHRDRRGDRRGDRPAGPGGDHPRVRGRPHGSRPIAPVPAARQIYVRRSPVSRAPQMTGAVILLHGTEGPVVPPAQAERGLDALEAAGNRCDLRFRLRERHGLRQVDTFTACLEAELSFCLAEVRL